MNEDLKFFPPLKENMPLYIELAGVTFADPAYHIRRTVSQVTVMEYVMDGEGYVCCAGEIHPVGRDTVYLLSQGEAHNYYSDSEKPFTKIFLNVSGSCSEHLVAAYGLSGKHFFSGSGLKPLFERIPQTIHSDMPENEMQAAFQGLFLEILSRISLAQVESSHSEEALKLKNHLDANLDRIVSAKELARVIFRSPDYCLKLFRREFGITPYAYQLNRKMHAAQSLLSDTHMSVAQIAESLGYDDPHYFSNLFKEKCGCRPLSYRKNSR